MSIIQLTLDQCYEKLLSDIKIWCRFSSIDNLLPTPTDEEIKMAIKIALDDINSFPPKTGLNVESTVNSQDASYTLLMYGSCKNTLWTLLLDWTANGIDAQLDSLSLQSKRPDYESLFNLVKEEFNIRLENYKKSYGLKGVSTRTSGNNRIRRSVLKAPFHGFGTGSIIGNTAQFNRG